MIRLWLWGLPKPKPKPEPFLWWKGEPHWYQRDEQLRQYETSNFMRSFAEMRHEPRCPHCAARAQAIRPGAHIIRPWAQSPYSDDAVFDRLVPRRIAEAPG